MKYLITTTKEKGNPFWGTSGDLLVLDTRVVAQVAAVDSVSKMKKLGEDQRKEFFKKRLVDSTNTANETISKNKLCLFSRLEKRKSHAQQQLSLKHDRNLFSTLYIACQVCDADIDDFFQQENNSFFPSLSDYGNMRLGTKANMLQCLEDLVPHNDSACS